VSLAFLRAPSPPNGPSAFFVCCGGLDLHSRNLLKHLCAQTRSARGHLEKPRHKPAPLQVTENIELGGISQGIPSRYPIPLQMGRIGAQEGFSTFIGSPGMAYNEEGMYGYEMTDSPDKRKRRHSPLFASPAAAGPAGRTYSTDVDPNSGWEEFGGPQSLSSACESPWGSRKVWP